jgi:DNA-binding NtrC family response regulator
VTNHPNILLVEDTPTMQMLYVSILATRGFTAVCADTIAQAQEELAGQYFPVILLDLSLPDGDGLDLLDEVLCDNPQAKVIVITANGSMSKAIEAMRRGACDFLVKPFNAEKLLNAVDLAFSDLRNASDPALTAAIHEDQAANFVGTSSSIARLRENIEVLGKTSVSVFVYGESGVDKCFCVSLLRQNSPNRNGPILEVNCSDPDQDAVAQRLFGGHRLNGQPRWGSTGQPSSDLFDRLSGGTLILKELGGLSDDNQTELLDLMQRAGAGGPDAASKSHPNVRIICTSTKDPFRAVIDGNLRQDLFFRLYIVPVIVPPLRERREDIVPCAESYLHLACAGRDRSVPSLSQDLKDLMTSYDWPGNLGEMREMILEMLSFYDDPVLEPSMLSAKMLENLRRGGHINTDNSARTVSDDIAVRKLVGLPLANMEQKFIEATIESCDGSLTKAATILNVAPSTLYRKRDSWQNSLVD